MTTNASMFVETMKNDEIDSKIMQTLYMEEPRLESNEISSLPVKLLHAID